MINPDKGPAIHTSEVRDFVRPSWSRYGVQSIPSAVLVNSQDAVTPVEGKAYRSFQCPM